MKTFEEYAKETEMHKAFLAAKETKTIDEHLDYCDYDFNNFMLMYDTPKDMERILENGFAYLYEYSEDTNDDTLLSDSEFIATICYAETNEAGINTIGEFIKTLKSLDVKDDSVISFLLYKYFDILYFNSEEAVIETKAFVDKCKVTDENERNVNLDQLINHLKEKKAQCENYKKVQTERLMDHTASYNFVGATNYKNKLYYLLRKFNYNLDYLLSNMPNIEFVKKDYELLLLYDKSIIPVSISLLTEYLLGDKELSSYSNDLGSYNIYKVGIFPVAYTKEDFIAGIHSELQQEEVLSEQTNFNRKK